MNNNPSLANGDMGMSFDQWLANGYTPQQTPNNYGTPDVNPSATGWGSNLKTGLGNASLAMQGITGAMGAWNAYQQNKLLKDQFKMSLADRNQNIANQAATTNSALNNQAIMAAQMMGHKVGTQGYDDYIAKNRVQVDGSPIKV